ncbi:O-antigen polymerase [Desulfofundulus luciae]|nr:O-antigen polymerase [Desulfofundulus luciae]
MESMEHLLLIALYLIMGFMCIMLSKLLGYGTINPVSVYFSIWSLDLLIYLVPSLDLRPLNFVTLVAMMLSAAAFSVGSFVMWITCRTIWPNRNDSILLRPLYDDRKLRRLYWMGFLMAVAYLILQVYLIWPTIQSLGGISSLFSPGEAINVRRGLINQTEQAAEADFTPGNLMLGLLGYMLFIGNITLFWGAYYLLRGRWFFGLFPLILSLMWSMLTLQRSTFTYALMLFLFSYYYHKHLLGRECTVHRSDRKSQIVLAFVLLGLLPLALYLPLKLRQPELSPLDTVESLLMYLVGPLAGFNVLLEEFRLIPENLGYGKWTFYGAASIIDRLGFNVTLPPPNFEYVAIQVTGDSIINIYTALRYFALDFGWLGIVVFPLMLGLASTLTHFQVIRRGAVWLIPGASVFMVIVFWSFFSPSLLRDFRYLLLLIMSSLVGQLILPLKARKSLGGVNICVPSKISPIKNSGN